MKFQILFKSLPIAIFAFFTVVGLNAQTDAPKKKTQHASKENIEANEARSEDEFAKELKLTPEQKASFKRADEEYKVKSKANKNARKEDQQRLREERIRAHKAALTPEQSKKYDKMMARKDAKHAQKQSQKAQKKGEKRAHKAEMKDQKAENKAIKKELKKQ